MKVHLHKIGRPQVDFQDTVRLGGYSENALRVRSIVAIIQPFLMDNADSLFHTTAFGLTGHKKIVSLDPRGREFPLIIAPSGSLILWMLVNIVITFISILQKTPNALVKRIFV